MSSPVNPSIIFYTTQTPNGNTALILLEELSISYHVHKHDFSARTHNELWYLKINPNSKIPAITDTFSDGVLKYLVERYNPGYRLWYPYGIRENYKLFSGRIPYALDRYHNESRRLYSGFIVGDKCTIVAIALWSIAATTPWAGVDLSEFPAVQEWYEWILQRPSAVREMNMPEPHGAIALEGDQTGIKIRGFEEFHRPWVMDGMKEDAKTLDAAKEN
ncbi:putative glutathione S-transferase [Aspergillus japonicus CBS 114.51]|uniref:Putative glutathione S-transferase n=1 Tax=Aspergillus japonicus CBS 114.51 TaxID=1448312 RepID=A0A8T8WV51_ASPJA|nr:putative glutathione S-transferase [Aspergillus japonicus CBS 114.51]RAH79706.1 putative glutathione S-transferase [Aspergillus japonicus CBS 114.51]